MSIKKDIKDEQALRTLVQEKISGITADTKASVGTLENDFVKFRRYQRIGLLIITAAFLLPNSVAFTLEVLFVNLTNFWSTIISASVFIVSLMLCSYYGVSFYNSGKAVMRQFHAKVDTVLFGAVFRLLGVKGELIEHTVVIDKKPIDGKGSTWAKTVDIVRAHLRSKNESPESEAVMHSLTQSELITEPFNTTHIDNVFAIEIEERRVMVSELHLQHITGSGRHRSVKEVFKGYFVALPLKKAVIGKTFVSTEGDTHGFAHRTYWNTLLAGETSVKETKFESNDFEKLLHVATDNNRESRELLTPDFMHDLYEWWKAQKNQNIRISFVGNLMYLVFPDEQIRFEHTVSRVESKLLEEYLLTIAVPLLHILHLVEDVRR